MKKQLIIAAIACAVSGAAFVAQAETVTTPAQDVALDLSIDNLPPTLTLGGGILTGGTVSLDFDNDKKDTNTIRKIMGDISMHADNYASGYQGNCQIKITTDNTFELKPAGDAVAVTTAINAGAPASIKYGIAKPLNAVLYGYDSQSDGSPSVNPNLTQSFTGTLGSAKFCHIDTALEIVIKDAPRYAIATSPDIGGLPVGEAVHMTDIMHIAGVVQ